MEWFEIVRIVLEILMAVFAAKPAAKATGTAVKKLTGRQ